jgi:mono/diheme cytochrome c family protein
MTRGKALVLTLGGLAILGGVYGVLLIRRGFSAKDEPSSIERVLARAARNLAIPGRAARETNPWKPTPDNLKEAREVFTDRCATCHGQDGKGRTDVGRNMYRSLRT